MALPAYFSSTIAYPSISGTKTEFPSRFSGIPSGTTQAEVIFNANMENINAKIYTLKKIFPTRSILADTNFPYSWLEVVNTAESSDLFAISALEEFCDYLSRGLANVISLLDIRHVIAGYGSSRNETAIVQILSDKLNSKAKDDSIKITVEKSILGETRLL